jgi:HK97 family phage major capsid protein
MLSGLVRNSNPTGQLAQQLVATADPDYASWWAKTLRHGTLVGAHLTIDEIKARERVENIERAMSIGTTTAGGFLLPFTLDPTIQLTSNGAVNPIRQIARVERTTTNGWRGVTSAGGTASFDAEASEVSDDTPVLAHPSFSVTVPRTSCRSRSSRGSSAGRTRPVSRSLSPPAASAPRRAPS